MHRTRHVVRALSILALLALPCGLVEVQAEEDEERPQAPLESRYYRVGTLTSGYPDFGREYAPSASPDDINDEEHPLFGWEGEEPIYPVGQIDELIELLTSTVRPVMWERLEGAGVSAMGEHALVIRAPREAHAEIGRFLTRMEQTQLRAIRIDVQALRMSAAQAQSLLANGRGTEVDGKRAASLFGSAAAGRGASLVAYSGQRAAAFSGYQQAFIGGAHGVVAEGSATTHALVNVANVGLALDVRAMVGEDPQTVQVSLSAVHAEAGETRRIPAGDGLVLDAPTFDVLDVRADLAVRSGTWNLIEGQGTDDEQASGWYLLLRASPVVPVGREAPAEGTVVLPAPAVDAGKPQVRFFDVRDLTYAPAPRQGVGMFVIPSRYTPPEPPELSEPEPIFPPDSMAEAVVSLIAPHAFESDLATVEVRNGTLIVRASATVQDAIAQNLSVLRREMLWSIAARADIVQVSGALARKLAAPDLAEPRDPVLSDEVAAELAEALASGAAKRLDSVRLTCSQGTRNAVFSGKTSAYVAEHNIRIAQTAIAASPIVRRVRSGMELDLDCNLASSGRSLGVDIRLVHGSLRGMRTVETAHGPIELPRLDVLRLRNSVRIPLGKTSVVGTASDGESVRLVLLTPTLERPH